MLAVIAAVCEGGMYGAGGKLPWEFYENKKLPRDLRNFKEKTVGNVIVMGRSTWESFGEKPLPNRIHIVVTSRAPENFHANVFFVNSFEQAMLLSVDYDDKNVFFIGGKKIWAEGLRIANTVYLTNVWKNYRCSYGNPKRFTDFAELSVKHPSFKEDTKERDQVRDCTSGINYDMLTYRR
jgi:dihydrofolate reductase